MVDSGPVQVDVDGLRRLAAGFGDGGRVVQGVAGGLDRGIPFVPDEPHELARRFVVFDEARERFDRSLADVLICCGGRLALVAEAAAAADAEGAERFAGGLGMVGG